MEMYVLMRTMCVMAMSEIPRIRKVLTQTKQCRSSFQFTQTHTEKGGRETRIDKKIKILLHSRNVLNKQPQWHSNAVAFKCVTIYTTNTHTTPKKQKNYQRKYR